MKKTFRSILAGAVALLAVSCYDDAALRSEIDKLDDRITVLENTLSNDVSGINSLASRLSDAENAIKDLNEDLGSVEGDIADLGSLATDLAALKNQVNDLVGRLDAADGKVDGIVKDLKEAVDALIEADKNFALKADVAGALAKIAVTNVTEVNGNVVLTLADGNTVELSKPLKNVENTGLVTVIQDGAEKYWAVKDADGKVTSLGVPVGHPDVDIEFSVASNGDLQYSVNGGELIDAGVNTNELASCLVADVVEKEDCVIITIGEVEYTLPKYVVDESSIAIKAGKTFFDYGEDKTFDLNITDIAAYYVMSKPDGWKAVIDKNKLVVTAPSEEAVKLFAEADGEILLHANTAEGKCKIAKLAVCTSAGFSLSLSEDGIVTIINPNVVTNTDWWGNTNTDFNDAFVGLATIADFEADPAAYVSAIGNYEYYGDDLNYMLASWKINSMDWETGEYTVGNKYVPGEYEVDVINVTVAKMYSDWSYKELPRGSQFVVWACPVDDMGAPSLEDLVYAYYTPVDVSAVLVSASCDEITVSMGLYGADSYIIGKVAKPMTYNYNTESYDLETYLSSYMEGLAYGVNYLGMEVSEGGDVEFKLSEIVVQDMEEPSPLAPGTGYYLYVMPMKNGKAWAEYTFDDIKPYIFEFNTEKLQPGSDVTVAFEKGECTFDLIAVNITPSVAGSTVYYRFYNPEDIDAVENLADDIIANGVPSADAVVEAREHVEGAGAQKALAALAVDETGKYGEINVEVFASKELVYSSTLTASFGEMTSAPYYSGYRYDFPINVEGGSAKAYYYVFSTTEYTDEALKNLPLTYNYDYNFRSTTKVSSGKLEGMYANASSTYYLAVVVESEDGEFAPVIKKKVEVPASAE